VACLKVDIKWMDSIASFAIETGGQKDHMEHGDVMPFSCLVKRCCGIHLYMCMGYAMHPVDLL